MVRKMFVVVSYDIPSNRTRRKLHKLLSGYGEWTQYSIFECIVSEKLYSELKKKIVKLVDSEIDSVRCYALCAPCKEKIEIIGNGSVAENPLSYVV